VFKDAGPFFIADSAVRGGDRSIFGKKIGCRYLMVIGKRSLKRPCPAL
jgi:hypothetical protein